jgi:hypothetical protein
MSPPFHAPPPDDGDVPSALARAAFILAGAFIATLFVSFFSAH